MHLKETTFSQAIQDGLRQSMELDKNVYVFGQLVNYQSGVFGSTTNLVKKFGKDRVQDFPVAEFNDLYVNWFILRDEKKNCFSSS